MVFSIMLSFSIPCLASTDLPLSSVLTDTVEISNYCSPISFTGDFILGTSVPLEDLLIGPHSDIGVPTRDSMAVYYRNIELHRFNYFGLCPENFTSTDDTSFELQSDVHYLVSFDLEFQVPNGYNPNPDNVYFALYTYDDGVTGKGTQVFGSVFKSSKVSPITPSRNRYFFDFAFTEDFINAHNVISFGVVVSDLGSSSSSRTIRTLFYNWDFKALDSSEYLIYRLKNPDEDMSIAVNEAQIRQKALESAEDELLSSASQKIDDVGVFEPERWDNLYTYINISGKMGQKWLDNIYAMNNNNNFVFFGINVAFMIGMFKFLVG